MRIGIDGCTLMGKRTGVGHYVYELCRALDRQLPQATFYVYSPVPVEMPVSSERWIARTDPSGWASKLKRILWLKTRVSYLCTQDQLDVFWAGGSFLPKLPPTVNTVMTVYDLNYLIVASTMNPATYWAYRLFFERDIRRADGILTISQGTADRLHRMLGHTAQGVVLPAVSSNFRRPSLNVITATLDKLGVLRPYLLAVSTLEPRKNLTLLIEVFVKLKRLGHLTQHRLVLVGGKGWKDGNLQRLLRQYADVGVMSLGYVAEADMPSLYAGADAFVFPSIYEGFGMPVLEARACGARIVASDIPEIREAGGIGPVYVKPTAELLCCAIQKVFAQDSAETDQLIPSWDDSAKVLAMALSSAQTSKE